MEPRRGSRYPGATASSLDRDLRAGDYRCQVTAKNGAGSATQTSAQHHLSPLGFGKQTRVTLKLASPQVAAGKPIAVRVANANEFPITGKLCFGSGGASKGRAGKPTGRPFKVKAGSKAVVRLSLPGPLRQSLARRGAVSLPLKATVTDLAGHSRTVTKKVLARLRKR